MGVARLTLALIRSLVLEGVGVDLTDLRTGLGVYAALRALSVPILIPNFEVANLCAAGLIVATLMVRLPFLGVFM